MGKILVKNESNQRSRLLGGAYGLPAKRDYPYHQPYRYGRFYRAIYADSADSFDEKRKYLGAY